MEPLINLSEPLTILITLILFILALLLAKETKKSAIIGVILVGFLAIIVGHSVEYVIAQDPTGQLSSMIARCIAMDFIFIFLSFISYLWIDDIEAREKKKKSINNSLDWFWKKV